VAETTIHTLKTQYRSKYSELTCLWNWFSYPNSTWRTFLVEHRSELYLQ